MNEKSRRLRAAWWPALAYMALIWVLSSFSHPPSVEGVPFKDKGVHFMEYGVLAALLLHAYRGTWPNARAVSVFAYAVFTAVLWGLLDEIHQAFVPGRNSDAMDLLADSIGAVLGAIAYSVAIKLRSARSR